MKLTLWAFFFEYLDSGVHHRYLAMLDTLQLECFLTRFVYTYFAGHGPAPSSSDFASCS